MLKTLALSLAELSREMTSSANTTSSAATAGATASSTSAPMSAKTSNPTLRLASNDAVGYNVAAFCTLCSLVVELARSCISQLAPMTHKHLIETILQLLQRGVLTSRRSHEKTQAPAATPSISSGTFATAAAAATPVSSNASENAVVLPAHHQQSLSTARSIIVGLKRQRDDNEYQDLRDNGNGSSASVNDGAAAAAAARRASTKINDTSAATLSSTVNDRLRLIGSCIELLQLLLAHPHVSLSHYSAMMQVSSTVSHSASLCVSLVRID